MAKLITNEKGFKVISLTRTEEVALFDDWGYCEACEEICERGFLIPMLETYFCPRCYNAWLPGATHYKCEEVKEERTLAWYIEKLRRLGAWVE